MSCEGRIPLAYRVRNKASPVNGSVPEINSLGCWTGTCDLPFEVASKADAAKAAKKSRRLISSGSPQLLPHDRVRPLGLSGDPADVPFYTLEKVNASKHKQPTFSQLNCHAKAASRCSGDLVGSGSPALG